MKKFLATFLILLILFLNYNVLNAEQIENERGKRINSNESSYLFNSQTLKGLITKSGAVEGLSRESNRSNNNFKTLLFKTSKPNVDIKILPDSVVKIKELEKVAEEYAKYNKKLEKNILYPNNNDLWYNLVNKQNYVDVKYFKKKEDEDCQKTKKMIRHFDKNKGNVYGINKNKLAIRTMESKTKNIVDKKKEGTVEDRVIKNQIDKALNTKVNSKLNDFGKSKKILNKAKISKKKFKIIKKSIKNKLRNYHLLPNNKHANLLKSLQNATLIKKLEKARNQPMNKKDKSLYLMALQSYSKIEIELKKLKKLLKNLKLN